MRAAIERVRLTGRKYGGRWVDLPFSNSPASEVLANTAAARPEKRVAAKGDLSFARVWEESTGRVNRLVEWEVPGAGWVAAPRQYQALAQFAGPVQVNLKVRLEALAGRSLRVVTYDHVTADEGQTDRLAELQRAEREALLAEQARILRAAQKAHEMRQSKVKVKSLADLGALLGR